MWCISCQKEVEHKYTYCQGDCGGNCQHTCTVCEKTTLASIVLNTNDTGYSAVKQAIGEAQRRSQQTGVKGEISVTMLEGNAFSGSHQSQVLIYNTQTGNYRINR